MDSASRGLREAAEALTVATHAMDPASIFAVSPVAQVLLDERHWVVQANPAWIARTGADPIGLPWIDLVHPDEIASELPHIGRLQADRQGYRVATRLASEVAGWIEVTVEVVPFGDGALATMLPTCHVQVRAARDPGVHERRILAAAMSHDLFQHARLASMYLLLLSRASLEGPHRRRLDTALTHVERLIAAQAALVRWLRLADFDLDLAPTDLGFLVARAAAAFSGVEVAYADLPTIEVDPILVEELFTALIGNVAAYAGTPAQVTASHADGHWQIEVADRGPGIPEESRLRVLDPFCRLHTWDQVPGHGMGLALASRIMQRHGGGLSIGGDPAGGCVVRLEFRG